MGKSLVFTACFAVVLSAALWAGGAPDNPHKKEVTVRKSPIAGSWYPGDEQSLRTMIHDLLGKAPVSDVKGRPFGVIAPHAGIQFSGQAAAAAFKTLKGDHISRVVLLGPSHYTHFSGIATSGVSYYETPLGNVPIERSICDALSEHGLFQGPRQAEMPEHSLEMEIPFLQVVLKEFALVPLVVGDLAKDEYAEAARLLKPYIDEKTIVVVSSDFTHYGPRFGYVPFRDNIKENLENLDKKAIDKILAKDLDGFLNYLAETHATICGARPIGLLIALVPPQAHGVLLDYYTSGDLLNDYADSVSYASLLFTVDQGE